MSEKKVNLFILGVLKCGTTSLSKLLEGHPEVFGPSIKETHFFSDDKQYRNGAAWYHNEFYSSHEARQARIWLDATPAILVSEEALRRVAEYAEPDAKFIVVLREPVARAISAYAHRQRVMDEELSFEDALDAEEERMNAVKAEGGRWWRHGYVEVGKYGEQLERAFAILGRERMLVMRQEDLRDFDQVKAQLTSFIGLTLPFPAEKAIHANPASMPRSKWFFRLLAHDNPLKRIAQVLLPRQFRNRFGYAIRSLNERPAQKPQISAETKARLHSAFVEDQRRLKALGLSSHSA
ncbi:sulfotransferase family protein [Qipengyuania marisflavi]|uniref:Sulfotransferase n=1 Tax=Qipengyuania marisflavi TaxID=2486356 RepID=A0A5S3P3Y0_9SPHN|nr:sulfotransferase [Qipengyuania marisflavi]TMM46741.1 sulfotransferase [Qipengyuania marisflavi]